MSNNFAVNVCTVLEKRSIVVCAFDSESVWISVWLKPSILSKQCLGAHLSRNVAATFRHNSQSWCCWGSCEQIHSILLFAICIRFALSLACRFCVTATHTHTHSLYSSKDERLLFVFMFSDFLCARPGFVSRHKFMREEEKKEMAKPDRSTNEEFERTQDDLCGCVTVWLCQCAHNKAHNQKRHPLEHNANKYNETITSNNGICLYCDDLRFWNSLDCGIGSWEWDIHWQVRCWFEYATRSHRTHNGERCNAIIWHRTWKNMPLLILRRLTRWHFTLGLARQIEREGNGMGRYGADEYISCLGCLFHDFIPLCALYPSAAHHGGKEKTSKHNRCIWVSVARLLFVYLFVCSIPSARQTHNEKLCRKCVSHLFFPCSDPTIFPFYSANRIPWMHDLDLTFDARTE